VSTDSRGAGASVVGPALRGPLPLAASGFAARGLSRAKADVLPWTAIQLIASVATAQQVTSAVALDEVGTCTAVEAIAVGIAVDPVPSGVAEHHVPVPTTVHGIVSGAEVDLVLVRPSANDVITITGPDDVVARETDDDIVAASAVDNVIARGANDRRQLAKADSRSLRGSSERRGGREQTPSYNSDTCDLESIHGYSHPSCLYARAGRMQSAPPGGGQEGPAGQCLSTRTRAKTPSTGPARDYEVLWRTPCVIREGRRAFQPT
jgi:hypothetical protein